MSFNILKDAKLTERPYVHIEEDYLQDNHSSDADAESAGEKSDSDELKNSDDEDENEDDSDNSVNLFDKITKAKMTTKEKQAEKKKAAIQLKSKKLQQTKLKKDAVKLINGLKKANEKKKTVNENNDEQDVVSYSSSTVSSCDRYQTAHILNIANQQILQNQYRQLNLYMETVLPARCLCVVKVYT